MKFTLAISAAMLAAGQQAGTQTAENHPQLPYSECTSSGCQSKPGKVVIDHNWRWLHEKGTTKNCYSGNKWDTSICPDAQTCTTNCVVEGADKEYSETYGVKTSGNALELNFVTQGPYSKNIGSRTFLMESDDSYMMFKLKNKEFTYTVDDSQLGCGLNGALYLVQMDQDGGKSKYGNAGAKYGLGYCDAQCPHDLKFINGEANSAGWKPSSTDPNSGAGTYGSCCTEIDIWEANKISTAYTMHACSGNGATRCSGITCGDNPTDRFKGMCDKNGCDIQAHRLGNKNFFGPGSNFMVDSTKPIQVTTQFITADGTDNGELSEVKQFYTQNGKKIELPEFNVKGKQHKTMTDDYCSDWVATTQDGTTFEQKGGLKQVGQSLEAGVVLVMSVWDDHDSNMLWLDGVFPKGATSPGADRGSCASSSGVPADVESQQANAKVTFSDIRFGPLGSTTPGGPSPTPTPQPTPSPSPVSDCSDYCSTVQPSGSIGCSWTSEWTCPWQTGDKKATDDGSIGYDCCCNRRHQQSDPCGGAVPTPPSPTPPQPTPSPSPSACPGGSLSACIDLCPVDVFAACVSSCQRRCGGEVSV